MLFIFLNVNSLYKVRCTLHNVHCALQSHKDLWRCQMVIALSLPWYHILGTFRFLQMTPIHLVGLTVPDEVPLDLRALILQLRVQRLLHQLLDWNNKSNGIICNQFSGCKSGMEGPLSTKQTFSPEHSSPQKPSGQPCKPQSPPLLASFSTLPPV